MIVRDEAHIVPEVIAAVAPLINSWVIVDTGSTDGTQDLIRRLMAERGIHGAGDMARARPWFVRRAEMGGWEEEVFFSMFRAAEVMDGLSEPPRFRSR